jgi:GNAT superfamily N-acetyltransferase
MRIRPAVHADALEIARVFVESWRWAYPGLVPQTYLDALSAQRHARHWAAAIAAKTSASIWVAHDERGCCGMASAGPARTMRYGVGEVYTLYVSPRVAGRGVGHSLLAYTVAQLKATMHASAILWVLENNVRARRFYAREGWSDDGKRGQEEIAGSSLTVVRYGRAL